MFAQDRFQNRKSENETFSPYFAATSSGKERKKNVDQKLSDVYSEKSFQISLLNFTIDERIKLFLELFSDQER